MTLLEAITTDSAAGLLQNKISEAQSARSISLRPPDTSLIPRIQTRQWEWPRGLREEFLLLRAFFFVTVPKRVFFLNYFAPPSKQKQRRVLFDSRVEAFCSTFVIVHSSLLPSMKQAAPLKDRTLSFLPPFLPPPQCRSQSSQHSHHIGSRRRLLSTLKRR